MVLAATHCHLAGRYRLCRWLAAGGMGQVWEAVDEVLDRPVAVKLLRDEYAQDPCFVRRLRAEAAMAPRSPIPGSPASLTTARSGRRTGRRRPPFWSWSWLPGSRCRGCWLGRDAWGWTGAWRSWGRPRWRSGRRIGPGWCTAISSRP